MGFIVSVIGSDGGYTDVGRKGDRGNADALAKEMSRATGVEIAVLVEQSGDALSEIARYADGEVLEPSSEQKLKAAERRPGREPPPVFVFGGASSLTRLRRP